MAKIITVDRGAVEYRIIDGKLKDRWIIFAYKINTTIFEDFGKVKLTHEVVDLIDEHVSAFVDEQVEPPAPIAATIKNFADDYVSSGKITIRAGDYISLRNYIRTGAPSSKS